MVLEFSMNEIRPTRARQRGTTTRRAANRLPGVVKTLILAHQIEQAVQEGRACDYADMARQMGVSRNRLTQIMSLLLLSPKIQAHLLTATTGITERQLRPVLQELDWGRQHDLFDAIMASTPNAGPA